jgi:hypothetical protein
MGLSEEEARRFESAFREGAVLVAVETGPRASEAAAILESHQGDVSGAGVTSRQIDVATPSGYSGKERRRRSGVGYTGPERRQEQLF